MARVVRALTALAVLIGTWAVTSVPGQPASAEIDDGDVLVDDAGGHVFATYGDAVRVYDLEGAHVATIPDQLGALELALSGRTLYVLAAGSPRVNAIDADTFEVEGGWSLSSFPNATSIDWGLGKLWFSYGGSADGGIGSIDPSTGTVTGQEVSGLYSGGDIEVTSSPARAYVLDLGMSPSKIWKYDLSVSPPKFLTSSPHSNACGNGRELALAPDATKAWTACGAPYKFNEFDPAILGEPATSYPATNYPSAVAVSADGTFLVGGTDSIYGLDIWFYKVGTPSTVRSWELGSSTTVVPGMVAASNGGAHVYAMGSDGVLRTYTQAPRISSIAPNHVSEGSATQVTVTGTGFGDLTAATVGGTTVARSVLNDTTMKLTIPAGLSVGAKPVVLTSPWGTNLAGGAAVVTVDPAKPDVPAPPTVVGSGTRSLDVAWIAPFDHGRAISGYTLRVYAEGAVEPLATRSVTGTSTTVTGLVSEQAYRFSVAATNAGGTSAASPLSDIGIAGNPDLGPFATLRAFVDRQSQDLLGRLPTSAERAAAIAGLANGSVSPAAHVVSLRRGADGTGTVDPVARLYRATFLRIPDRSGLDYWIGKKRRGTKLTAIAESFARSSEFVRRYGTLSDRAYVERLYTNVLGRPGDGGGVEYWTTKLTTRSRTRGQVLAGMSESNEYRRTQASEVDVAVLYIALLRRAPTTAEFTQAVAALDGGKTAAELAAEILASPAYAARF
jgi:hypothetical protein